MQTRQEFLLVRAATRLLALRCKKSTYLGKIFEARFGAKENALKAQAEANSLKAYASAPG